MIFVHYFGTDNFLVLFQWDPMRNIAGMSESVQQIRLCSRKIICLPKKNSKEETEAV